ncbi:hypothetical protein MBLNU457_7546t1 [Dothideomycetes sp. NU457]
MEAPEESRPFGERLLTPILDERARQTPHRVFAEIPKGQTLEDGFRNYTYAEMASAVNVMARWLQSELEKDPEPSRDPVPYIGPNDMRYILIFFAAQKIGRAILIPLRYNSPEAQVSLIRQSKSKHLFSSACSKALWEPTLAAFGNDISHSEVPPVDFFLYHDPIPNIPTTRTWNEVKDEYAVILQSSGTTGVPKILPWTFSAFARMDAFHGFADELLIPSIYHAGARVIMAQDMSWGVSIFLGGAFPIWSDVIAIFLPPDAPNPMSADYLYDAHKIARPSIAMFIPTLLRDIVRDEKRRDIFPALEALTYAGAPLDTATGDMLETMTKVSSAIGSTELGIHPHLYSDDVPHWSYLNFATSYEGYELRPFIVEDQIYEMVVVKQGPDDRRPCFLLNPETGVYSLNELWQQHPTEKQWYKMIGRADDFVKLSSMTKFNAAEIERWIGQDEHVETCLVGGDERACPFAVIQLKEGQNGEEALGSIWKTAERVNERLFSEARLRKEFVIIPHEKKIIRTAKDTVGRKATLKLFEDEIEHLYQKC